jgi:hypothetical protein
MHPLAAARLNPAYRARIDAVSPLGEAAALSMRKPMTAALKAFWQPG